jgi:hypothetical protein
LQCDGREHPPGFQIFHCGLRRVLISDAHIRPIGPYRAAVRQSAGTF